MNCENCKYYCSVNFSENRGTCLHPKALDKNHDDIFDLGNLLFSKPVSAKKLNLKSTFKRMDVKNKDWPLNFDPDTIKHCDGFEGKDE